MDMDAVRDFFDLTDNEAAVLDVLTDAGIVTTGDITKRTGISRPNCYDVLNKLIHKGLVSKVERNNKVEYKINKVNYENLIKQRHERLRQLEDDLEQFNQQVQGALDAAAHHYDVSIFNGKQGLQKVLADTYDTGQITSFGAEGILEQEYPRIWDSWIRKLQKKEIPLRVIYNARYQEEREETTIDIIEARFIDRDFFATVTTQVLDEQVNLYFWQPHLLIISVESRELAENYRNEFRFFWEQAE